MYQGSCHCGEVKYEFQAEIKSAIECNCSMCSRKGTILAFVPDSDFKLLSGAASLTDYLFHKRVLHHTFCKVCGVTPFISGADPTGNKIKAINLRCLEGFDLKSVPISQVDGKSF